MTISPEEDPREPYYYNRFRLRDLRALLFLVGVAGLGDWSQALRPWSPENAVAFAVLCWLLVALVVWWPWSSARKRRRRDRRLRLERLHEERDLVWAPV